MVNITIRVKEVLGGEVPLVRGAVLASSHVIGGEVDVLVRLAYKRDVAMRSIPEGFLRPGEMLLLRRCVESERQPHGRSTWLASAVESLGNAENRKVVYGYSRITVVPGTPSTRPRAHVDILHPDQAEQIRSIDGLRDFFESYLGGHTDDIECAGNTVLRLIAPAGGKPITMWVYSAREQFEFPPAPGETRPRRFSAPAGVDKTWDEAITRGEQAKGLVKMVAAALTGDFAGLDKRHTKLAEDMRGDLQRGDLVIEGIPGERVRIIGDSLDYLQTPGKRLAWAVEACKMESDDGKPMLGFVPMTVLELIGAMKDSTYRTVVASRCIPDEGVAPTTVDRLPTALLPGVDRGE